MGPGQNCYGSDHGALNLGDTFGEIGTDNCRQKCEATPGCTGFVILNVNGRCFLRSNFSPMVQAARPMKPIRPRCSPMRMVLAQTAFVSQRARGARRVVWIRGVRSFNAVARTRLTFTITSAR